MASKGGKADDPEADVEDHTLGKELLEALEFHKQRLAKICRICGETAIKPVPKQRFISDIKHIYGIDLEADNDFQHPSDICGAHASVFYRYRASTSRNETFSTSMEFTEFMPHTQNNCSYCRPDTNTTHTEAMSRKRKWQPYGRGKRGNFITLSTPTCENTQRKCDFDSLIETIENLSEDELDSVIRRLTKQKKIHIMETIIKDELTNIQKDIEINQKKFSNISELTHLDISKYLIEQNETLVTFIRTISKSSTFEIDETFRQAILLESLYRLRNSHFVGPVSLLQNLTILSLTKSKAALDIIGSSGAGGKYSTLSKWLSLSPSEMPLPPSGDALFVFDNEQMIGKTWSIKPQNKIKTSVITTVAAMELDAEMKFECNRIYHPAEWFTREKVHKLVEGLAEGEGSMNDDLKKIHFDQFKLFVTAIIEQLTEEKDGTSDTIDKLLAKIQQSRDFKICLDCNILLPKSKRKCTQCKKELTKNNVEDGINETADSISISSFTPKGRNMATLSTRYDHVTSNHPKQPIPVTVMEPVFVNPNSHERLIMVLRHIGKIAGLRRYGGKSREWLIICCDGLPYTMLFKLIQEYMVCSSCNKGLLGIDLVSQHRKEHQDEVQFIREFDWVLLHTGDGHYEMNLMKAFMSLNWDVCMKELVNRMGWNSEMAMKAAKMCYDNHKTWQLLLVFHLGTLMELIRPYIRNCTDAPTAKGFFLFAKSQEANPNYMYLFQMVSRYSQAIINFRMGMRRNNSDLLQSAKYMPKGLFHGRSHPRYQQIEMIDAVQRTLIPDDLKEFIKSHESMTKTTDSKGQGYDFILEEVNKDIKSWLHRGVATDRLWQNVCRSHDNLKKIREQILQMLHQESEENKVRKIDLEAAICDWRVLLREKEYLSKECFTHKSLSGTPLHHNLCNFTREAERMRTYRLMEYFLQEDTGTNVVNLKQNVYVTETEATQQQAFENQTVEVIDKIIVDFIEAIPDADVKDTFMTTFQTEIRRKKKTIHIKFFEELIESMNETSPPEDEDSA